VRKAAVLMGLDWEKIRKIVSCGRKGREGAKEGGRERREEER